ncbi:hypothetical protein GDO78_017045 [Eleutherodactylus coqui]|uniref:Taste receptor type 2 n=1 Tax=Eleutherodactylus coqui TaxID=57060 RepID=A0A8J6B8Y0_ELECQ|nr:hypothetical protein GDO78_017045 [Eleutherodactylus coqui]
MADSTQGHTDIQYLGLLAPALIALIVGLVIHSFIIGVNVTDWWKGRSVTPVDHITTLLGISRMWCQCVTTLNVVLVTFFTSKLHSQLILHIMYALSDFFMYVNFWLMSLLSIVLCLKISNFQTRLFLYLKGVIVHRTVYFIVVAVLINAVNIVMTFLKKLAKNTYGGTYNTTKANFSMDCTPNNDIFNYTSRASIPMFFYCISSLLLFTSLYHHTIKMKMSSNSSINLETYYSTMKFISFTFLYNIIYFFGHFASSGFYYFYCVHLVWLRIVLEFLPVLHSSYLIYRTAKLRSQMAKVLQNVTDFLFPRKYTESRVNIEVVVL